jgi:cation diffusion facilitator CzcD-associated flavoprotein CzcO
LSEHKRTLNGRHKPEYDAIVVGGGLTGLYQLYRLRRLGLSVRLFEHGGGVGGTWYWNRYPGCCFDSESEIYSYSFSEELLQEWTWKHHYSLQPDTERYYNYATDKFNLRPHIQLNSEVVGATWDESARHWTVRLGSGEVARARFLILALGILSAPARYVPNIPGADEFGGEVLFTSRWPHDSVSFEGRRVALFGTGSSGVQLMPFIAREANHLAVFQRTPTYCAPLRNARVSEQTQREWRASYDEILREAKENPRGYRYLPDARKAMDVPQDERWAMYETLWARPGFAKWMENFHDITSDPRASADYSEFVKGKIRERIRSPRMAEKLVPHDHPFGAKRLPMEDGYYECFDHDNVTLVDVRETPVERITRDGIKTTAASYEFDTIIFATGFDAFTGGVTRIDIQGATGETLKSAWSDGPRSYLNMMTDGFPNLFTAIPRAFCNYPRCSELIVEWVADCIAHMEERGLTRIAPTPEAEAGWGDHVMELGKDLIFEKANSWFNGGNIPGKKRVFLLYPSTLPQYRKEITDAAESGYDGFALA